MTASVTGGTGFLGSAVLAELAARDITTRALVRPGSDEDAVRMAGAVPVQGDITWSEGLPAAIGPAEVVFHCAAKRGPAGSWRLFRQSIVAGTRNVLQAAVRQGVRRFVYASTAAVYDWRIEGNRLTLVPGRVARRPVGPYARAKAAAEQLVQTACDRAGMEWVILRLGIIYGPGDRALAGYRASDSPARRMLYIGDGGNRLAVVYVSDAARAVVSAGMTPGAAGQAYDVASNETVTQKQFLDAMADTLLLPRPPAHVRPEMALGVARVAKSISRLPFADPAILLAVAGVPPAMAILAADQCLRTEPTRRELGWRAEVDFATGMARMGEWYRRTFGLAEVPACRGPRWGRSVNGLRVPWRLVVAKRIVRALQPLLRSQGDG